uniref:Transposase (Putative), gypsy type n=1 Tax=Tanacetum cinerariifolium TaxID=118510 RepID=A0A699GLR0_TANCI|nr:hypothetical protein [Tanacetum cinerariifolium]
MTEGRTVSLDPPIIAASGDRSDSIDKLFDEGNDAGQEHSVERDDDVLEDTIAKGASEGGLSSWSFRYGGKSLATICELVSDGSSVPSGVTGPHTVVFVPPTPDDGPTDYAPGPNLSFARSLAKDAPVTTVVVTTTVTADASIVLPPRIRVVLIVVDSTSVGRVNADVVDHLAPPALFAQLRAIDYDQLYFEFNVGAARQVCLGVEVRMRAEHTLERKGELEDKCAEQATFLSERDTEIAADAAKGGELRDLKKKNFSLEGERDVMFEKIATLESANAAKELSCDELDSEVASLESKRDCLVTQENTLESGFELFRERIEALQDEQAKFLSDRAIGCTVNKGIQDGLKAGIDHGQACRDLSVIEAYDPFAEAKYIDVVNALGAVDFSLLSELESKKDSCIVDLMNSLCLEGILAEIPRAENLQPSPEQLMLLIHRSKDDVVIRETSFSTSLQVVYLRVQRFRGEVKEKRLLLTNVINPLAEPLSTKSLTRDANISAAPITTLSTTFSFLMLSFLLQLSVTEFWMRSRIMKILLP